MQYPIAAPLLSIHKYPTSFVVNIIKEIWRIETDMKWCGAFFACFLKGGLSWQQPGCEIPDDVPREPEDDGEIN